MPSSNAAPPPPAPPVKLDDPSTPIIRPSNVSLALDGAAKFTDPVLNVERDANSGEVKLKVIDSSSSRSR